MNKNLFVALVSLACAGTAFAAVTNEASTTVEGSSAEGTILAIGPMVSMSNGTVSYGPQLDFAASISESFPIKLGFGAGLLYSRVQNPGVEVSSYMIPLMFQARYEINVPKSRAVFYFGADLGMAFGRSESSVEVGPLSITSAEDGGAVFQGDLRSGIRVGYFYFEPRLGFSSNRLMMRTTAGLAFNL